MEKQPHSTARLNELELEPHDGTRTTQKLHSAQLECDFDSSPKASYVHATYRIGGSGLLRDVVSWRDC